MPNDNALGGDSSDGGMDISQILTGSSQSDTGDAQADGSSAQGDASQSQGQAFKFANKEWKDQAAAEKHFNKIYGQFSDTQGLVNKLKQAFQRDPESIAALAQDPQWAEILGKLGIDAATREVEERRTEEAKGAPQNWEEYRSQMDVERAEGRLEREQWKFEKRLGRDLAPDELREVYGVIESSPSLTIEQAYKLAFHDKLLKEAATKGMNGNTARSSVGRPKPPPSFLPGQKLDLKKPLTAMSKEEARAAMRADIPELLRQSEGKR